MAVALLVAGCGGEDGDAAPPPGSTGRRTSTAPAEEAPPEPPFGVGRVELTLVDRTRGTQAVPDAEVGARPDRTLEVTVAYPAAGDPAEEPTAPTVWDDPGTSDAVQVAVDKAEPATGPFPLVVFGHGWNGGGGSFLAFAEKWAREGYVVALPTFPLSRSGIAFSDDYVNQPGDLSFVIDELLATEEGPLAGLVDGERIAVGGHSLGAATVFRGVYNACCTDERIDATITASGGPLDITEPGYADQPDVPMLLAHGAQDGLVPVAVGDAMVGFVTAEVTYLKVTDGTHTSLFTGEDGELFSTAVLAFLDAELQDDPTALDALPDVVAESGRAELRTG